MNEVGVYKKPCTQSVYRRFLRRSFVIQYAEMNLTVALSCMVMIMWLFCGRCRAAPLTNDIHLLKLPYFPFSIRVLPGAEEFVEDLLSEDEDGLRLSKRQQLDDYGHMRFGKRSSGDEYDYGHSRFGRRFE